MEEQLISIIIPVYNVENYLDRCLDSVINQTYKYIDVVVIDDGSTDRSGQIADSYAANHEYIRVFHKRNEGIGATRNLGIELAKGDYILFVDSDDYIDSKMVEIMYGTTLKYHADLVCCNKYRVHEKNNHGMQTVEGLDKVKVFNKKEALGVFLLTNYVDVVFWNKLIKKELFNGVRCPNHIYEDVSSVYKLLLNSEVIVCINDSLYFYCQRESSITDEGYNEKMKFLRRAVDDNYDNIVRIYPDLKQQLMLAKIHWYMVIYDKIILNCSRNKLLKRELKSLIWENLTYINKTPLLSRGKRYQYDLFLFSEKIYRIVYRVFYKLKR